jgi:hypothetical protein
MSIHQVLNSSSSAEPVLVFDEFVLRAISLIQVLLFPLLGIGGLILEIGLP